MKTKLTFEFDSESDSKLDANAHLRGPDLALCIYVLQERIRREWEACDEGGVMDTLIKDTCDIVEKYIGNVDDYTE